MSSIMRGPDERRLTPMMRQYLDAKAEHPDAILMFRMGDFFEMFFEDACIAAKELDIVLTTRDKERGPEGGIPMAGVPHHAVSSYIARLVDHGHSVAICDQIEDPKKAKGLVKREITRLVTPGTILDLEALDPAAASYIAYVAAPAAADQAFVVALMELLAGEVLVTHCPADALADELHRMGVREILTDEALVEQVSELLAEQSRIPVRRMDGDRPEAEVREILANRFGTCEIQGLADGGTADERRAVERLVAFAERTQRRSLRHLMQPRAYHTSDALVLDEVTRRNLELCTTQLDNRRFGSLIWHLDRCRTAMGSRRLTQWMLFPLRDPVSIEDRLDTLQILKEGDELRDTIARMLDGVRDIERLLGRVAVGSANPRDLAAIRASLARIPALQETLANQPSSLGRRWASLDPATQLTDLLERALVDEPPISPTEGGIFRRGYRADLDELIALSSEGHDFLADLERRERQRTGIANLKVRYNKVFGYFIEVTRANLNQVPDDYVRKQTLVGAERFITDELKKYEDKVLGADERRKMRENELFDELVAKVASQTAALRVISRLVADTDAFASLAQVAGEGRWVRPALTREPVLELEESRHPVLERLMPDGERFVPNDITLNADKEQLAIVTGPNMAGKSTVMRQAALTTILAHMGSFVPARRARIGVCDRVFTRVGAADNLGRGRSTFMVEMIETAAILQHATRHSLVLLDEIGRGTSTFDGLSIAWAVAEHLHDTIRCRAMFATHYHELTDLALDKDRIVNISVAVKEQGGRVVFLRRLVEGAANRSYGIQVARLAGLPDSVVRRAREVLDNLEAGELDERGMPALAWSHKRQPPGGQLHLFAPPRSLASEVEQAVEALDPLNMTPLQAIAEIERLKSLLDKRRF